MAFHSRIAVVALAAASTMLVLVASASATTIKSTEDITGLVFTCPTVAMTAPPGSLIYFTEHDGAAANGNTNFTVTAEARHNRLLGDDGRTYSEDGSLWFGGTYNADTTLSQFTFTGKLQFVTSGTGTVGSVNITFHLSPNGSVRDLTFGDCIPPFTPPGG
jgi:glucose/arabinose dehydrogenase